MVILKLLPFSNYYAGGISSVRGFKQNTLGPRAIPSQFYLDNEGNPITGDDGNPILNPYSYYRDDRSIGGAYLIEGGFDFIFKLPFIEDQSQFRTAFFVDLGNVFSTFCYNYQTQCFTPNFEDLRGSYGLGGSAITPFGPISVYFAVPFNNDPLDRTKRFEFTVGNKF